MSSYLINDIDQVIETIHVDDELFEAKETFITGIQIPNDESTEELFEISSNKIVDNIDISSCQICSDDQKPEVIIVTTEEIISSKELFSIHLISIDLFRYYN